MASLGHGFNLGRPRVANRAPWESLTEKADLAHQVTERIEISAPRTANGQGLSWFVSSAVLAEIAQHAGHADIIREAVGGQRTMG
ncbi:MAG: DUF664 domain-containing protein [Propionibacteriaceae bacterium]|nr:DUF664 domain-containing protein [Propionibacteriaceae bacterium]